MEIATKERLTDRTIWVRLLYTIIFAIAYAVAETIVVLVAIFQFLSAVVTGNVNEAALRFGANLSAYVYHILQFVTFNDEALPFPFSDWPDEEPGESPWRARDRESEGRPSQPDDLPQEDDDEIT